MDSKQQFNYQAVLEACEEQNVSIKKAFEEKCESEAKFHENLETFKRLQAELEEKNEKLSCLKLLQGKRTYKMNKIMYKTAVLNKELKLVQEETAKLQMELQKQSDDFIKKVIKIAEEEKLLHSQFEGETLTKTINDLNMELLYFRDTERKLEQQYEELKKFKPDTSEYERLPILKTLIGSLIPEVGDIEDLKKKISDKKKNIQFLETECNKNMELLHMYD